MQNPRKLVFEKVIRHINETPTRELVLHAFTSVAVPIASIFLTKWVFSKLVKDMKSPDSSSDKGSSRKRQILDFLKERGRIVDSGLETDTYEDMILAAVTLPEEIGVTFDDIGGLDSLKRNVYDTVLLPLKRSDKFTQKRLLAPPKGALLYGPPGTGKTMIAKAIAKDSHAVFINVSLSLVHTKWFGDSERLVNALFSLARKLAPTIIFIDEVDAFLKKRGSYEHHVRGELKAEFLSLWDGFTSKDDQNVIVLGASNRPYDIDDAFLRRMPRTFEFDLPGESEREVILIKILKNESKRDDVDLTTLARMTQGYSGSDLNELCKLAAQFPFREYAHRQLEKEDEKDDIRAICMADLVSATREVRPTGAAARMYLAKTKMAENSQTNVNSIKSMEKLLGTFAQLSAQSSGSASSTEPNNAEHEELLSSDSDNTSSDSESDDEEEVPHAFGVE